MGVLNPYRLEEEISREAEERRITTYGASYIVLAKKHGLILVTEDKSLKPKRGFQTLI